MHQITSSKQLKKSSENLEENDDWVEDDDVSEADLFEEDDDGEELADGSEEIAGERLKDNSQGKPAEVTKIMKIGDLRNGMKHVTVEARIDFVGEGNRKGAGYGENIYVPAFIRDGTGEIKLVFWNDDARKAKSGKMVRIVDGFVSQFRGELQLNSNRKKGVEFL